MKNQKKSGSKKVSRKKLKLALAGSSMELKLDLGCGQNVREGFEGVDLYGEKAKHKVDLFKFPWPFKDESVDELHASHFLEHIPAREVEGRDLLMPSGKRPETSADFPGVHYLGADMLFAFMDECYRILKPNGYMQIIVPSGRSARAFQDPTHRRFFMQETFIYFAEPWRVANGLDHYRVKANFHPEIGHSMPTEESLQSAEAQAYRALHYWNTTVDWIAKLRKLPPMTKDEKAAAHEAIRIAQAAAKAQGT